MAERASRWASTMAGHGAGHGVQLAHADSWAGTGSAHAGRPRRARGPRATQLLALHATRAHGAGNRAHRGGARPVAHLLRARPRPHPARQRVPPTGRQDPGVRVPRRPPAHPADPRARGRPGGHVGRPRARAQRRAHRGDRARSRLRPRPRRPRQRGRAHPVRRRAATTMPCGAPTSRSPASTCARETLDGIRNHSWSRPAPHDARGRGRQLGRPHRLRLPRLRGCRRRRHRQRRHAARRSCATAAAHAAHSSSARSSRP